MKYIFKVLGMAILLLPSASQAADSYSFGAEREMKESGEKGGTTDINIGVGELQEVKPEHRIHKGDKDKKTGKKPSRLDLDDVETRRDTY